MRAATPRRRSDVASRRRVRWVRRVILLVVVGVLSFLAGGLARSLFIRQGPELIVSTGEVTVNDTPVTEPTALREKDVVEVVAGRGDIFFAEDRWLRLTPDAEVSLTEEESVEHREGTGWYRAGGEQPLSIAVGGVDVLVEGAVLVVDEVVIVADGVADVDGTRLPANKAVFGGEVVDLAPDQVYADPWVVAHLEADHRSEALAGRPLPVTEDTLLGEYRAELTVVASEFTDEPGTSMERDADVILRCETRPCTMVLRLARTGGWVEFPLSWTGTGYTSAVSTVWPCLTDQRLVDDDVYRAELGLELNPDGVGTLLLNLTGSSAPEVCHNGTASFALNLGERK